MIKNFRAVRLDEQHFFPFMGIYRLFCLIFVFLVNITHNNLQNFL